MTLLYFNMRDTFWKKLGSSHDAWWEYKIRYCPNNGVASWISAEPFRYDKRWYKETGSCWTWYKLQIGIIYSIQWTKELKQTVMDPLKTVNLNINEMQSALLNFLFEKSFGWWSWQSQYLKGMLPNKTNIVYKFHQCLIE